ncbi:MAG TPA: gfo/Idh/MocA family oxidoreductase [Firmicutes bacterium]|nr:gfo/Idh/MocA family oxidoreductase [Bacillota bacterium]
MQDNSIEMVYIPLPNHIHAEWIKKAADYGKHIICEKPLALNASEAQNAIDYAIQKGVRVMEAFMYKFHPQWQRVLELVKFGEIGRITTIHTFFGYSNTDPENIRNIKEFGGGALLDIGCYAVSTARFLLQAEPKRVLSIATFDKAFYTDITASCILDFGTVQTLFTVGTQTYSNQKVEIFGTDGSITIEIPFNIYPDVAAKVTVQNGVGIRTLELGPADQYLLEFEGFARSIGERKNAPSAYDAVNNMKVLDALFKSAESAVWEQV